VPLSDIDWDGLVISHSTNPVAWIPMLVRNHEDRKYDLLLEMPRYLPVICLKRLFF